VEHTFYTARRKRWFMPKQVLIVDDSVESAESLALVVEHMGHVVSTAHDGAAALLAARRMRHDVVLLDIGLPAMDGYEVARRLRNEVDAGMVIVAVSGFSQQQDREQAIAAGFDHYLVKPVEEGFLSSLLGTQLATGQAVRPGRRGVSGYTG
jgi:CheY-like chemotaxis protein